MRNTILLILATGLVFLVILKESDGKVFSRCELKKALEKNKVNRSFIAHCKLSVYSIRSLIGVFHKNSCFLEIGVCLAENESGRNSSMLKKRVLYDMYGIFQVNKITFLKSQYHLSS